MATLSLPQVYPSSRSLSSSSSFRAISSRKQTSQFLIIKPITKFTKHNIIVKATKEEDPPIPSIPPTSQNSESSNSETLVTPAKDELSEIGEEIKKAMQERAKKEGGEKDFWSGVAEEIGEIEWPAFGKVLGTTGVVMGVIAGSSVVLLTVNALLAELSDKVFAGRGVQDFFG